MFELYADGQRLILASPESEGETARSGINMHALSPILLGILLPIVAIYIWDPAAMRHMRIVLYTVLFGLMCAAVGLFVYSVMNPGRIVSVVCNKADRVVELTWQGVVATKSMAVPVRRDRRRPTAHRLRPRRLFRHGRRARVALARDGTAASRHHRVAGQVHAPGDRARLRAASGLLLAAANLRPWWPPSAA